MSLLTSVLDLVLAGAVVACGGALLVPFGLLLRALRRRRPNHTRRIVYLGTGQIAQVFPRNGANLFLERECSDFSGYFSELWNVHFPAGGRGRFDLTPRHHLLDCDVSVPPALARWRRTAMAIREILFLAWLVQFVWRCRASVLTATNPYLQGANAAVVGRLLALPYAVIITRDYDWDWAVLGKRAFASVFPSRRIERAIGRSVLRHADLVLADRRYYAEFAIRNGAARQRTHVTRVLADRAFAAARASADVRERYVPGPGPVLLYIGRLDPDKFALDLVECLARVRRQVPDARLACAGTGSLVEQMRCRAEALGVADGVLMLGSVDLADLPDLIASSDVVVAPHMGYTLIEAGLTGVPIVTYDFDFHPEVIEDGRSGYLVPLRDVDALAERVCRVLSDRQRAAAMGAHLRAHLLREHALEQVVPLYCQAYASILGEGCR